MSLKLKLRNLFQRITGLYLYQNLPFGIDPLKDIQRRYAQHQMSTFFDVGANVGEYAQHISKTFPNATIWCFEPIAATYAVLETNTKKLNVRCHQIGLAAENHEMTVAIDQSNRSDMHSLAHPVHTQNPDLAEETITLKTLDFFCQQKTIAEIDYLKIDTEGYDLEVLKGATNLLQNQQVAFVEVEVSMNPENTYHIDFASVKNFMESHQYRLFGIYDQMYEWQSNTHILRRTNPVFVAQKVYQKRL